MTKNKYLSVAVADEPLYDEELEEQIVRLRAVLSMMSPETGSQALGAMRHHLPQAPLAERVKALIAYQRHG